MGRPRYVSIWVWAFGYFAAYAPYSLLTKALSDGKLGAKVSGAAILPISTLSSVVAAFAFLLATGWWRSASTKQLGQRRLPVPTRWTAMSGLCGAVILTTTTIAYTFEGVSIVFMMLLMRGGLLAMAPVIDAISRRKVQWYSWVALGLTMLALIVATWGRVDLKVSFVALLNVGVYLAAYFVRLRVMSRFAKNESTEDTRRYFVEEQLVSTPAAFLALGVLAALATDGSALLEIRRGFTELPFSGQWGWPVLIGVLSQGTGIFGALVLLDKSENSFSVPVNRASSVLAGVVATLLLHWLLQEPALKLQEGLGAAFVTAAVLVLSLPSLARKKPAPTT